ncbi:MAG: SUMF1/EgtB/PvdO family nonheme iron enzyme [Gemmataceae bacterium]|nr:SUMF1/EgtB/PvdO family nonheme iron enzyme [Gemmataceae bacterium]
MTTEDVLLQAVLADPAAGDTWLVLADWLEETGQDDRAELLRLQIRLRSEPNLRARSAPEKRVRALLAAGVKPCVPALVNSVGMRLVLVPPGLFWQGSRSSPEPRQPDELPRRLVHITRPFFLGATPVTQGQYEVVAGTNPSAFRPAPGTEDRSRWPVESVSYRDIAEFLALLSAFKEEKKAGRAYRLATEAEWEYACRGCVCQSPYSFGPRLRHADASFGRRYGGTPPEVGRYPANLFGLHDMHGTIWEWVADRYDDGYYSYGPEKDPPGPRRGSRRVLRGGGWSTPADLCRSALRGHNTVTAREDYNGFRVALTPPERLP